MQPHAPSLSETWCFGQFLGGCVYFTGPWRPLGLRECPDHCFLNSPGPAPDSALWSAPDFVHISQYPQFGGVAEAPWVFRRRCYLANW